MKNLKRIVSFFLSLVMMLSMMSITAFAEETGEDTLYQETDPYVYVFMDSSVVPDEWKGKMAWYLSSHRPEFVLKDSYDIREGVPTVIALYNSSENEMMKTYCLDLQVETVSNTRYRRLNLEDSTYFSDENAELLRAIFLNGFIDPADTSDLQNAANEWLADQGMEQITDLTSAQALSATQYAIWLISAEDEFADSTIYNATVPSKDRWLGMIKYTDDPNPKETAVIDDDGNNITEKNITLFAEYLLNLDGVAPSTVLVSDATLADADAGDAVLEDDDTYSVTVTVNIDGVKDGDELYLTVGSGEKTDAGYEKSNTVAVTASGEQAVTLTGLTEEEANGALSVEINGQQTGSDVYMFDAPGNRGTSQTMIGYDNSVMPVHAKAIIGEEERVLKIYKTTPADEQGNTTPLPNIQFVIYQVATTEQIESGEVVVDSVPADEDVTKYATHKNEVVTVTTDENGYAEYNFTRNGMPDGVYMIVEHPTASIKAAIAPFFISIPMTNETGDGYIYEIVAKPK
ncbi:MAG: thioester domain-containing protein, partial [Clostridia bacterium]|nr:thioester domain-containing protein [Clostridia bacterium]